jgi:hypothetical protein
VARDPSGYYNAGPAIVYIYWRYLPSIGQAVSASSVLVFVPQSISMGRFNSNNYKSTDYAREIDQARSDLEFDYPNARVFINFADGGSPSVRCKPISLVAPDGQANVVTHHLELPGKVFGTNGYDCFVFSEGALEYGGKFGYVSKRLQDV